MVSLFGFNRLQFPLGAMKLTCVLALLVALANADEGSQQLRGASPDAAGQELDEGYDDLESKR